MPAGNPASQRDQMKLLALATMMTAVVLSPCSAKAQYYDYWQRMQTNVHLMNANTSAFECNIRAFHEANPSSNQLQYIP